ncbi:MAG: Orotidine 5'-phosphate decarboxylase [Sarea resinae]|nr:MAG: Orotidine 5'-phosphate decarboxylase [Sarea resinae]
MASSTPLTSSSLPDYKASFLSACLTSSVLKFGTFTLKSGRQSPYFFNAGLFHRADLLHSISVAFAHTLAGHLSSQPPELTPDVIFGPAYKAIPLATATVTELAALDEKRFGSLSYSFNRKEAKDHGEGGNIVGSPLRGKKVFIVDDVITAGTAIREAIDIIKREGGQLVGIVVALDRQEKMPSTTDDDGAPRPSAIGEVRRQYGVPVLSILTLDEIIEGLTGVGDKDDVRRLDEYRKRYRASD